MIELFSYISYIIINEQIMKNYTLSENLFNQFGEINESLDHLEEVFPNLVNKEEFIKNSYNSIATKLHVILVYKTHIEENVHEAFSMDSYDSREKYFAVSEEFLMENNVDINLALNHQFIYEDITVNFTSAEVFEIIRCLNNVTTVPAGNIHDEIKEKLGNAIK